jgi:hypothetical protein
VSDKFSLPFKTTDKFRVLHDLITYIFGKESWKTKDLAGNDRKSVPFLQSALHFFLILDTSFLSKELTKIFIFLLLPKS